VCVWLTAAAGVQGALKSCWEDQKETDGAGEGDSSNNCISSHIFVFCIIVTNLALWLPKTNKAYLLTYLLTYSAACWLTVLLLNAMLYDSCWYQLSSRIVLLTTTVTLSCSKWSYEQPVVVQCCTSVDCQHTLWWLKNRSFIARLELIQTHRNLLVTNVEARVHVNPWICWSIQLLWRSLPVWWIFTCVTPHYTVS